MLLYPLATRNGVKDVAPWKHPGTYRCVARALDFQSLFSIGPVVNA